MKNFKLKTNSIFNFIKRNILIKNINNFLEYVKNTVKLGNIKKKLLENYNNFYEKKFKINYLIFIFSIFFFYYLIYLSFPGILHKKSEQNYFTDLLKKQYGLEFSLTPEINYSILPKPHFQIKDVIIFNKKENFQKEIAQVKKIKIYLYQNNFFKKKNLEIKSIELFEPNFFFDKLDIPRIKLFFKNGFKGRPVLIKRANLFYQDVDKGTISFINFKKINLFHNNKINQDILVSEGDVFNVPFSLSWKQDLNKFEQTTNLKFPKIKLQILNLAKLSEKDKRNKLQIYLNRSRYIINYDIKNKIIKFVSNNSFIGNDKFIFKGEILSDPFNFDIKSSLDNLRLDKFLSNSIFMNEIFSNDFILNENFNGKIKFNVDKLEKNPLFNKLHISAKFIGETIDLSTTSFFNKKIANLIIKNGVLYENQNNLIFKGSLDFTINDLDKFNNKFLIPKKNRIKLNKLSFDVMINLTDFDIKILKIVNDNLKEKEFEKIDELVYEFNSGAIEISNWIEFKIFTNKIISSYSG